MIENWSWTRFIFGAAITSASYLVWDRVYSRVLTGKWTGTPEEIKRDSRGWIERVRDLYGI